MESSTQDNKLKPDILPLNSPPVVKKFKPSFVDILEAIMEEYFNALKQ